VAKRPMSVLFVVIVLALGLVALAWIDGGREEQRLVVEPVSLPDVAA
jgi:hypothetical protein